MFLISKQGRENDQKREKCQKVDISRSKYYLETNCLRMLYLAGTPVPLFFPNIVPTLVPIRPKTSSGQLTNKLTPQIIGSTLNN